MVKIEEDESAIMKSENLGGVTIAQFPSLHWLPNNSLKGDRKLQMLCEEIFPRIFE